jgi:hypothetical protein
MLKINHPKIFVLRFLVENIENDELLTELKKRSRFFRPKRINLIY